MKILNIAGARPNFMKIAPLMAAMADVPSIEAKLIHTGQHYDAAMSEVFFDELGIPHPDENLEVHAPTREEQIELIMERFDPIVTREKPDAVLVVGDVNSTIACARVALAHNIAIVHVEAGLRSFDQAMPEEINRVETDQISNYLFVTEASGMRNLEQEKIAGQRFLVGNVMIDTLCRHIEKSRSLKVAHRFGLTEKDYVVGTFHRPSNVDSADALRRVLDIIEYVAEQRTIVMPLHPRTKGSLESHNWLSDLQSNKNVKLVDPLGYLEFISLVDTARCIVTDSGGVQEETTYLGVPCITMRDNTERPVTVDVGSNILAGTDPLKVIAAYDQVIAEGMPNAKVPELWDGQAAPRIIEKLQQLL